MFNQDEMDELQEYYGQILSATKGIIQAMGNDGELLDSIAQLSKKLHDSYMKAGFTSEQAFELVSKSDFLKQAGNNK